MRAHRIVPNSDENTVKIMLSKMGLSSISDLFSDVPREIVLREPPNIGEGIEEEELEREAREILRLNLTAEDARCFLGGGIWDHFVPPLVDFIASRQEFLTAYTPYQAETSQGALQAIFEYQSLICELTGMDVASASLYDWSTALAEAARLAIRVTRRRKVVIPRSAHPERREVLRTYLRPLGVDVVEVPYLGEEGTVDLEALEGSADDAAMIYLESPNFFGVVEDSVEAAADLAHSRGALAAVGVDPLALGVMRPPGEQGADVVVGEGQHLGSPMSFGGPSLGIMAVRGEMRLVRQMPGRLIGMTVSADGLRGFTMALQTREQHIRQERATSNITSNESLLAIRAAVYLTLLGEEGIRSLGLKLVASSAYLMRRISEIAGLEAPVFSGFHFKEFLVRAEGIDWSEIPERMARSGFLGPLPIGRWYGELYDCALTAVTERLTKEDMDSFADALGEGVRP